MTEDLHDRLRVFWDADAETYDHSPGHAVADPAEAAAWRASMLELLPPPPARLLDAGAGTGAMSLLAAELSYRVTALDLSPGMLARLEAKARERGLGIETVIGPADDPPAGPFDAVMERHLIWTVPDPVGTLAAWRRVAPRTVLFEGLWGGRGRLHRLRRTAVETARRARGVPKDHHDEYAPDLRASLPLAGGLAVQPLVDAAARAGWRRYRVVRLREVEAARRRAAKWPLGALESVPRFALVLE
jgi:SAM-dependent methyltransferase